MVFYDTPSGSAAFSTGSMTCAARRLTMAMRTTSRALARTSYDGWWIPNRLVHNSNQTPELPVYDAEAYRRR
ncbi:MAG: hypothetical protein ACI9W2_004296 [Gammaproteobacteria bacterium]|jgi:hypothetical protein